MEVARRLPQHRQQGHQGGDMDLGAEEAERGGQVALVAAVHRAGQAEAPAVLRAEVPAKTPGLALIVAAVKSPAAGASPRPDLRPKVPIELQKLRLEVDVADE
jgi:hypothetical protein